MASLRLNWYKFKHSYLDFIKVLVGIILFEGLIMFIQDKGFLENFETTRMTLFLLLFSSSLLILVQNSIYISKERDILNRDFFSGLRRGEYALVTLAMNAIFAMIETFVFVIGLQFFSQLFDKDLENKGILLAHYGTEVAMTVFLVFVCSHFIALAISAVVGKSEITSVILAVILGIMQFSLSGTILKLPKSVEWLDKGIYLGYGHKLFGMTNHLKNLPSAMADFHITIEKSQLKQFDASKALVGQDWSILALHALIYALLFIIILKYKKE